jgi:hypothetical protein
MGVGSAGSQRLVAVAGIDKKNAASATATFAFINMIDPVRKPFDLAKLIDISSSQLWFEFVVQPFKVDK